MVFAVADEDAVGAVELGGEGIGAIGAVADEEFEGAALRLEIANGVRFGVGEIDVAGGVEGDAFGAGEGRGEGGGPPSPEKPLTPVPAKVVT